MSPQVGAFVFVRASSHPRKTGHHQCMALQRERAVVVGGPPSCEPLQVAQDLPAGDDGQLDAHLLQLREQVRGYIERAAGDMEAPGPVTVAFQAPLRPKAPPPGVWLPPLAPEPPQAPPPSQTSPSQS